MFEKSSNQNDYTCILLVVVVFVMHPNTKKKMNIMNINKKELKKA